MRWSHVRLCYQFFLHFSIFRSLADSIVTDANTTALNFADFGNLGITGSRDGKIKVWDLTKSGLTRAQLPVLGGPICNIACSPCGTYIASSSSRNEHDCQVGVWRSDDIGQPLLTLEGAKSNATCVKFYKDSELVLTGHKDGVVRLWNTSTHEVEDEFSCVAGSEGHAGSSAEEDSVMAGSGTGEYSLLGPGVTNITISTDGKVLMAGTNDGTLVAWNLTKRTKKQKKIMNGHYHPIVEITFTPANNTSQHSDKYLISADKSGTTLVRDYGTLDVIAADRHDGVGEKGAELGCVGVGLDSTQSMRLVRWYSSGKIEVCSIPDLEPVSVIKQDGNLTSVNYLHGRLITTACDGDGSGCVQIWDRGVCTQRIVTDCGITSAVTMYVNRNGILVYGCEDGCVGMFLYTPHTDNERHIVLDVMEQSSPATVTPVTAHNHTLLSAVSKSRISQTTLHSLKEVLETDNGEQEKKNETVLVEREERDKENATPPKTKDGDTVVVLEQPSDEGRVKGGDLKEGAEAKGIGKQESSSTCNIL